MKRNREFIPRENTPGVSPKLRLGLLLLEMVIDCPGMRALRDRLYPSLEKQSQLCCDGAELNHEAMTSRRDEDKGTTSFARVSPWGSILIAALCLSCAVFLFLLPAIAEGEADGEREPAMLAKVIIDNEDQLMSFLALHPDIASGNRKENYYIIVTNKEEISFLRKQGFSVDVLIPDLAKKIARAGYGTADFGAFHTYQETVAELNSIYNNHSDIVSAPLSIGSSWENRTIWAIKVSDNPDSDEDEPEVLYTGLHHAREPITVEVLLYFINYLTDNYGTDPTVTQLVNERELWFVPVLNPDGYVYNESLSSRMWRKNRRDNGDGTYGVDLNRNYSYLWGYDDSGSSPVTGDGDYRGPVAFSEPETQAIRDFCQAHAFVLALNYHSYGNLFMYPWSFTYAYTVDHDTFSGIAERMTLGNNYQTGTGPELLYVTNGDADDWMYGSLTDKNSIYSFTPEVGNDSDGFWPDEDRIQPLCEENLAPNIFLAGIANNPDGVLNTSSWYLAEGCTAGSFETWVLIMNPNTTAAACQLTFMKPDGSNVIENIFIGAESRATVYVNEHVPNESVSTKIESVNGQIVKAERAMYWDTGGINWVGGHCSIGVNESRSTWYLAEGCTGGSFDTWVLVMNPNDAAADCRVTFMKSDGTTVIENLTIEAKARGTIHVNNYIEDDSVSTKIECTNGQTVISERAMYWDSGGLIWVGGHCSIGAIAPSYIWYLPEGYTAGGFDTWILLMNPNNVSADCQLTFMKSNGSTVVMNTSIAAMSRETILVNDYVPADSVSTKVECTNGQTIIAERAMYWDSGNLRWAGGHCSIGSTSTAHTWYLAEGCTDGSFDDWILIMNPSDIAAACQVSFMSVNGIITTENITVGATSRGTIHVNDYVPGESISTKLISTNGVGVIAECAMYWDSGGYSRIGGHCRKGSE